ncbi:hypothetical protein A6E05_00485 [Aliivibrio sp. 1S165]|uniref:DUF3466 family protein n=1 Tax=unclassified Aliivibrio TaxID=2645654 RepID=UPI00080DEF4E|nr:MULTISPECIES: DUF3466 family protein [unclassified Aliivibrio]OCH18864.1 hypothetical protein A6E05_00485 [Aliivibrio sp. 1S165]OCH30942.1 hypothetical protein A6E06_05020 [Aliivibrio sp. 1S175]
MSSKLQLTTLAVLVSAALPAQAALYKVVEVTPGVSGTEYYGTAIQPSPIADNTTFPKGCFEKDCGLGTDYKLAGETRERPDGFSYREEVPFAMDNSFGYIEDDYDGFEDYCNYQLGYATCEYWASDRWSSWSNETYGSNSQNSLAFIEATPEAPANSINTVINSLDSSGNAVGNYSTTTVRNTPIHGDITGWKQGRQWVTDGTYSVGSVSSKTGVGGERYEYYSKAAVWNGTALTAINWNHNNTQDGDYFAQGSMRDLYVNGTTFYGVGYNNYDDQHMNATIFKGDTSNLALITSTQINNAQVDISGDNINTNSVATDINKNLVVVGQAKRSGSYPQNGAAANRLFIVTDASVSSNASFFSGGIFFDGAGGEMGGINNFNEIVGRIDSENFREYDGKQRRQRAFIYPYGLTPNVTNSTEKTAITDRKTIFQNKAWLLDDLTNDGSTSGNNQYRIYNASDINDAGVISATAVKCSGGYDSTSHNAYCGDGNRDETVIAVKLVPISDDTQRSIQPRGYESTATERQGAGFGFGALTLLSLFGFMRKRIK